MKTITYEEFEQVELRAGIIIKVMDFPRAKKPAFKVWADFGGEVGILQTSAQITVNYSKDSLIGMKIIGCINLGEKDIAGFKSQFLLVGFNSQDGSICLATTSQNVLNGSKLH